MGFIESAEEAPEEKTISDREAFELLCRFADSGIDPSGFSEEEKEAISNLALKIFGETCSLPDMVRYYHDLLDGRKPAYIKAMKDILGEKRKEFGFTGNDTHEEGADTAADILKQISGMKARIEKGEFSVEDYAEGFQLVLPIIMQKGKTQKKNLEAAKNLFDSLRGLLTQDLAEIITVVLEGINGIADDPEVRKQHQLILDRQAETEFYLFKKYMEKGFEREEALRLILSRKQTGVIGEVLGSLSQTEEK